MLSTVFEKYSRIHVRVKSSFENFEIKKINNLKLKIQNQKKSFS